MLYRMLLWQPMAVIKLDDGHCYRAASIKVWMKETSAEKDRAGDAVKRLRGLKFINTKIRKFDGAPTLHMRLDLRVCLIFKDGLARNGFTAIPEMDLRHSPKTLNNEDVMENNKGEEDNADGVLSSNLFKSVSGVPKEEGRLIDRDLSFDNARKVWSVYWRQKFDGPVDGFPNSTKARKMFKDWAKKVPKNQPALHLIARAVGNWPEFQGIVKTRTGKRIPDYPDLYAVLYNLPSLLDVSETKAIEAQRIPKKQEGLSMSEIMKRQEQNQ